MTRDPLSVSPELALDRTLLLMGERRLRHLPVVEHQRLVGIVSERDLLEATGWAPHRALEGGGLPKRVRDHMSVRVETTAPDASVSSAAATLLERRIGCLPVLEGQALRGIVSETDLVAAYARASRGHRGEREVDPDLAEVFDPAPVTIGSDATVEQGIACCRARGIRHLPVVSDGWFVGLVSDRDLLLRAGRGEGATRKIGDVMATDVEALDPATPLSEAARVILQRRIGSVAVTLAGGKLLGLVTTSDVLLRCRDLEQEFWEGRRRPAAPQG